MAANTAAPLVSIIITNYNYATYLNEAIDSALHQSYPNVEVFVVDDGSDDGSREIIEGYGERIVPIFRDRGGQCAACNEGFLRSRGDVVIFLDADDVLLEQAADLHVAHLADGKAMKSCGFMQVIDSEGKPTGRRSPRKLPESGDYRAITVIHGLDIFQVSLTSAHAWSRRFLEQVMPVPEDGPLGIDGYLTAIDRVFGRVEFIHEEVVRYRRHEHNSGPARFVFDAQYMRMRLARKRYRIAYAEQWIHQLGLRVDPQRFRRRRDWRLALMQHVLMLWGEGEETLPFTEFVKSPLQVKRSNLAASLGIASGLLGVRLAPKPLAIRMARKMLTSSQRRRTTFHESELVEGESSAGPMPSHQAP